MSSFCKRSDWLVAGVVSLAALVAYVVTLAPTVTLEQSGALVVAGQYLGVGRVPGYPVWHLLAHLFTKLFVFVTYHGHPNPAWALNFMSAVFGSLSCGLVALLVHRVGRSMVLEPVRRMEAFVRLKVPSISAGCLFAVSHTMWTQSVITETDTLTCFFFLLLVLCLFRWVWRPSRAIALFAALLLGVSLAQSHMLVLFVPLYLAVMLSVDPKLCVSMLTSVCLLWLGLIAQGAAPHGLRITAVACALALSVLVPIRLFPQTRCAIAMLLLFVLGLSLYIYIPVASSGGPPMNFGYGHTWEGFKHVISRGQYERMTLTSDLRRYAQQLALYFRLLRGEYTWPVVLIGFIPLALGCRFKGVSRRWLVLTFSTWVLYSAVVMIGVNPKLDVQTVWIVRRLFIPSFALYAALIGYGWIFLIDALPVRSVPDNR